MEWYVRTSLYSRPNALCLLRCTKKHISTSISWLSSTASALNSHFTLYSWGKEESSQGEKSVPTQTLSRATASYLYLIVHVSVAHRTNPSRMGYHLKQLQHIQQVFKDQSDFSLSCDEERRHIDVMGSKDQLRLNWNLPRLILQR